MQTTKPETAQQRPTGARMALLMLLYFIKIRRIHLRQRMEHHRQMEREVRGRARLDDQERPAGAHRRGQEPARHHGGEHHSALRYQMAGVLGGICAAIGLCHPRRRHPYHRDGIYDALKITTGLVGLKGVQCAVAPSSAARPSLSAKMP